MLPITMLLKFRTRLSLTVGTYNMNTISELELSERLFSLYASKLVTWCIMIYDIFKQDALMTHAIILHHIYSVSVSYLNCVAGLVFHFILNIYFNFQKYCCFLSMNHKCFVVLS